MLFFPTYTYALVVCLQIVFPRLLSKESVWIPFLCFYLDSGYCNPLALEKINEKREPFQVSSMEITSKNYWGLWKLNVWMHFFKNTTGLEDLWTMQTWIPRKSWNMLPSIFRPQWAVVREEVLGHQHQQQWHLPPYPWQMHQRHVNPRDTSSQWFRMRHLNGICKPLVQLMVNVSMIFCSLILLLGFTMSHFLLNRGSCWAWTALIKFRYPVWIWWCPKTALVYWIQHLLLHHNLLHLVFLPWVSHCPGWKAMGQVGF